MTSHKHLSFCIGCIALLMLSFNKKNPADNPYVMANKDGSISYKPDARGNVIPDFSGVGYHQGDRELPVVPVMKTISAIINGDSQQIIQDAINEVSALKPDRNGYRGTILLRRGIYRIPGKLYIRASGIVLRGEGDDVSGTRLLATGKGQRTLLSVTGKGALKEETAGSVKIADAFVPVGAKSFNVESAKGLKKGDRIILYRPGTDNWVTDLKMDRIEARPGLVQWKAEEYNLKFERNITNIEGNKVFIDNPVVMQIDRKYGGGEIYKYAFPGRIAEIGIENVRFESEYASDTDEDHGWVAIDFDKAENCWVKNVTSMYFGFGCVNIKNFARYITVKDSKCLDAKSVITGGRRYSFNINGQLNLVINCEATEGRHDFVTGAKVCGPNVFYNCSAKHTHSDIGPHHRWAVGTLYDNIRTDGIINVQDRGNYGTGHGWAGVTQVIWNCTALKAAVQSPWVSGDNYCIGLKGEKWSGRYTGRPDGQWADQNSTAEPESLYMAQVQAKKVKKN